MNSISANESDTLLLIIPKERAFYGVSPEAFHQGQAPRNRLENDYSGALVVSRIGIVQAINSVEIVQPFGSTLWRKILSRLTDAWSLRIDFSEPLDFSVDQVKEILDDCLKSRRSLEFIEVEITPEDVIQAMRRARTFPELFSALRLPHVQDALDVL